MPLTEFTAGMLGASISIHRCEKVIACANADGSISPEVRNAARRFLGARLSQDIQGFFSSLRMGSEKTAALIFPRERSMPIPEKGRIVVLKLGKERLK